MNDLTVLLLHVYYLLSYSEFTYYVFYKRYVNTSKHLWKKMKSVVLLLLLLFFLYCYFIYCFTINCTSLYSMYISYDWIDARLNPRNAYSNSGLFMLAFDKTFSICQDCVSMRIYQCCRELFEMNCEDNFQNELELCVCVCVCTQSVHGLHNTRGKHLLYTSETFVSNYNIKFFANTTYWYPYSSKILKNTMKIFSMSQSVWFLFSAISAD